MLAFSVDKTIEVMDTARARASQEAGGFLASYLVWTGSSLVLCGLSVACVHLIGPSAAGSGIPQMKCVLAGVQIHDYLSIRTLVAKLPSETYLEWHAIAAMYLTAVAALALGVFLALWAAIPPWVPRTLVALGGAAAFVHLVIFLALLELPAIITPLPVFAFLSIAALARTLWQPRDAESKYKLLG